MRAIRPAALLGALLLPAVLIAAPTQGEPSGSAPHARADSPWTRINTGTGSNITIPSLLRTPDGVLHVVYEQEADDFEDLRAHHRLHDRCRARSHQRGLQLGHAGQRPPADPYRDRRHARDLRRPPGHQHREPVLRRAPLYRRQRRERCELGRAVGGLVQERLRLRVVRHVRLAPPGRQHAGRVDPQRRHSVPRRTARPAGRPGGSGRPGLHRAGLLPLLHHQRRDGRRRVGRVVLQRRGRRHLRQADLPDPGREHQGSALLHER